MGASSDGPVVIGPSEFFEPVGGLAGLTLDDILAGVDEMLDTTPDAGTANIPADGTLDLTNNFRVDISGLPTTNVTKVAWTKSGKLTVTVSMTDFDGWRDWYQSYVTLGDTGAGLDGTLTFLGSDLTTETGSIDFSGLTPTSLTVAPLEANSDRVAEFVVSFDSEGAKVSSGATPNATGSGSTTPPAGATPPAVNPAAANPTPPAAPTNPAGAASTPTEGTVDLTSNFRVDLSPLPTTNVSRATWTKAGRLTLTIPMSDWERWQDWYQSFVTRGDTGASLDGALVFLGSDLTTETGSVDFTGLIPISLNTKPLAPGSDQVAEFVVTLEADKVRVKSPATGTMVPVFPLSLIPSWLGPLVSDAQQSGVSDDFISGSLGEELYRPDGGPPSDLPNALLAFEERLSVEALLFGGNVNLVESPFALSGISGGGTYGPLEAIVTSTGGSTGEVMDMYLVNNGKAGAQIDFEGLVLEPVEDLTDAQLQRVRQVMAASLAGKDPDESPFALSGRLPLGRPAPGAGSFLLVSGPAAWTSAWSAPARRPAAQTAPQLSVTKVGLDAYCLEFEALVPTEGVVFRVADRTTQAAHSSMRSILTASRRLNEQGVLRPDSDPAAYYHSIRQWAIWVDERDLARAQYEDTFVEHTQKNFEAAGQVWSADVEELVRSLAPNRWSDIQRILDEATAWRATRADENR